MPPTDLDASSSGPRNPPGVVVHVPEGDPVRWEAIVRNVGNLRDALDAATLVELVAHGPGLPLLLRGGPLAGDLVALDGVRMVACGNTMERLGVDVSDLLAGVVVVPAGIAHLVHRQGEGWAYVRP